VSSGWQLTGEVRFVRPGQGGSHWLLPAECEQGLALFQSPFGAPDLAVLQELRADGTSVAHLRCQGLRLSEADCLGVGPSVTAALTAALDEALVMNAVELLAMIRRMRAMTMQYLAERNQFGRPIGSFQTLQHRAVDLLIHEELTAAVIGQAIAGLDAGRPERERSSLASRAKARASETAVLTVRESIQMHGAIGTTDEYDLGLYVNRTLALCPWLGNAAHHRKRFLGLNPPGSGEQ
jgi:alkylation response protein AidB-like acyl-CoA dehydrogenase